MLFIHRMEAGRSHSVQNDSSISQAAEFIKGEVSLEFLVTNLNDVHDLEIHPAVQ